MLNFELQYIIDLENFLYRFLHCVGIKNKFKKSLKSVAVWFDSLRLESLPSNL